MVYNEDVLLISSGGCKFGLEELCHYIICVSVNPDETHWARGQRIAVNTFFTRRAVQ